MRAGTGRRRCRNWLQSAVCCLRIGISRNRTGSAGNGARAQSEEGARRGGGLRRRPLRHRSFSARSPHLATERRMACMSAFGFLEPRCDWKRKVRRVATRPCADQLPKVLSAPTTTADLLVHCSDLSEVVAWRERRNESDAERHRANWQAEFGSRSVCGRNWGGGNREAAPEREPNLVVGGGERGDVEKRQTRDP